MGAVEVRESGEVRCPHCGVVDGRTPQRLVLNGLVGKRSECGIECRGCGELYMIMRTGDEVYRVWATYGAGR